MAGLFGTLLLAGAEIAKAAYDDSQVKKNNESEDFQEEFQGAIAELQNQSDIKLLKNFHREYDDNYGRGFFVIDTGNRMDPMFMAYMDVFKHRGFKRLEVRCSKCDRRLGYRMATKEYRKIKNETDLTHGDCRCDRCDGIKTWAIKEDFYGECCIDTYDFYYY